MTRFTFQRVGDEYRYLFETDIKEACDHMAEAAQRLADRWTNNGGLDPVPTADAVPLRHGRWLTTDAYPHHLYCSLCYKTYLKNAQWLDTLGVPTNFCPNCGARMEWGEKK